MSKHLKRYLKIVEEPFLQVISSYEDAVKAKLHGVGLTLGAFDGVHRGHQHLIETLKTVAKGVPTGVITFDPHPGKILAPTPLPRLFDKDDQIKCFKKLNLDFAFFLSFDRALAEIDAVDFANKFIFDLFQPRFLVVGYDFVFGKNRGGHFDLLAQMAQKVGTKVVQEKAFVVDKDVVSSSLVRRNLLVGDVVKAKEFLGRPFYVHGEVIRGRQLGRQLGVPTANLKVNGEILPMAGVYCCRIEREGGQRYTSVCNVGFNPTVSNDLLQKVECHIFDFNEDVYGENLKVEFHHRLRDEQKFSSLETLTHQIQKDMADAQKYFASHRE